MKKDELGYWIVVGVIAWWIALFSAGCASVVSSVGDGHPNRKEMPLTPGATAITLAGTYPDSDGNGIVKIPRGAGAFRPNTGRVEKDGYMTGVVQRRINWWVLGNGVYGGFPGLVVDFAGGGAYNPTVVYLAKPESTK